MFNPITQNFCTACRHIALGFLVLMLMESTIYGQEQTVKVKAKGRSYFGKSLAYDGDNIVLLRRDGRISILPISRKADVEVVSNPFKPYSFESLRSKLQKEFGGKYQVSQTRNFVVVHPIGDFQNWAMPFENLYQRFRNYFSSRGFSLDKPEFPMVAVVLRTRKEFDKFLRLYHTYDANTLGYYSQKSNRIIAYDPSNGRSTRKDWAYNDTLIHEAVHQTAFNTGVHRRFGFTPQWVLEGLACMFEASGIQNSTYYAELKNRINKGRLARLKYYYSKDQAQGKLKQFVQGDQYFDSNPSLAYSYSWGLTFFLAEKFPAKFFRFLTDDASREEFRAYGPSDRVKAFKKFFGDDLNAMDKRLERFIGELKVQ